MKEKSVMQDDDMICCIDVLVWLFVALVERMMSRFQGKRNGFA